MMELPDPLGLLFCPPPGLLRPELPWVAAVGVAFLSGLRARLQQPLRLLQRRDDRLQASLTAATETNHRVASAVMSVALHTDLLAQRARGSAFGPGLEQTCQQLTRIAGLVAEVREALAGHVGDEVEGVEWRPVAQSVTERRGLSLELADALPARVLCAQGKAGLERILEELVDNVPPGAAARVQVRASGPLHLCLAVVDEGPGLTWAAEEAREPFVTDRAGAPGLGLFLVDCLAKASGARLEVSPREGGGTFAGVHFLGATAHD